MRLALAAVLALAVLAPPAASACTASLTRPLGGNRNAPEIQGSGHLWGLVFLPQGGRWTAPSSAVFAGIVRKQVKIVFRLTGAGPLRLVAYGPSGARRPFWGPQAHTGSTWNRPGAEWGAGFVFPRKGCWRIHASRRGASGDIRLTVG